MTNLLELVKESDEKINNYLMNVDISEFKADILEIKTEDLQTEIDKKIDQLNSQNL